jgi:uroporphyrinogen-III synthase
MSGPTTVDPSAGRPLSGWRVVVTGDAERTRDLDRRVSELGASVVRLPVVAVSEPSDAGAALDAAVGRLLASAYDWVLVTSANGVERLHRSLAGRPVPATVRWAAVGPSTSRTLEAVGLPCHLAPSAATADDLVDALVATSTPARALYPRAERVRTDVAGRLRAAGWSVDDVVAYRTVGATPDPSQCEAARAADAVLFTSGSAVEHTVVALGRAGVPDVVVTIGPATSTAVRDQGLAVSTEAVPHSIDGMVGALVGETVGREPGHRGSRHEP